jgi:hypothetical protein
MNNVASRRIDPRQREPGRIYRWFKRATTPFDNRRLMATMVHLHFPLITLLHSVWALAVLIHHRGES